MKKKIFNKVSNNQKNNKNILIKNRLTQIS